jgi:hypothetical protein
MIGIIRCSLAERAPSSLSQQMTWSRLGLSPLAVCPARGPAPGLRGRAGR